MKGEEQHTIRPDFLPPSSCLLYYQNAQDERGRILRRDDVTLAAPLQCVVRSLSCGGMD